MHGSNGQTPGATPAGSDNGKVIGVITSTDVLILTVHEKYNIIEQLERYISPGGY